jgi:hypothetical protein
VRHNWTFKLTAQAVGTERPCFICYKPTTIVLATINTVDFLYTCSTHLSDPGFATKVAADEASSPKSTPAVSQEAIDKIKEEWEEKQRKRKEKEKEKEKQKDGGDDGNKGKAKKDDESEGAATKKTKSPPPATSPTPSSSSASTTPVTPSHEKYVLHRDMFALRQAEHRRRRQANQAKDLAPRLPAAPKSNIQ